MQKYVVISVTVFFLVKMFHIGYCILIELVELTACCKYNNVLEPRIQCFVNVKLNNDFQGINKNVTINKSFIFWKPRTKWVHHNHGTFGIKSSNQGLEMTKPQKSISSLHVTFLHRVSRHSIFVFETSLTEVKFLAWYSNWKSNYSSLTNRKSHNKRSQRIPHRPLRAGDHSLSYEFWNS